MSIFLIIPFHLKQQAWFRVCVVPMVPITFRFIIPLTWCHRRPITSSWNLSTKLFMIVINILSSSRISIEFMLRNTILAPRWFVLSAATLLPSLQHKLVRVMCYTLRSLLSSICSPLPWSITIFYLKNVVRISPPLKNSWYGDTSHHHHSFLVPVLFLTGIPAIELWCVNSKLLATLLLWSNGRVSFKFFCSSNHHSNIGRATQPVLRAHPSTNV